MKCLKFWAATAAMLALSGTAQAALVLQPNSLEVLDTETNLLWMYNWGVSSRRNWEDSKTWAAGLTLGGAAAGEWRLPNYDEYLDLRIQIGFNSNALLFHFVNVEQNFGLYWIGTEFELAPDKAWYFRGVGNGFPSIVGKDFEMYAVAVRAGPAVTAVPEPQTLALALLALGAAATAGVASVPRRAAGKRSAPARERRVQADGMRARRLPG